ncbi:hypothetical protein C2845_PM02G46150 [Panicum miliaceum]|uniref:Uncharacterized protein n=1 Tax=Panicum miliaceum TaxID=4540 RepID=A0A3L6SH54_PANMI|nr:hypothetical protein C2845_PM02G46150 [Panicum miliaceum]
MAVPAPLPPPHSTLSPLRPSSPATFFSLKFNRQPAKLAAPDVRVCDVWFPNPSAIFASARLLTTRRLPDATPRAARARLPTPCHAPTTVDSDQAAGQPRQPMEGNDDGEGEQEQVALADVTSAGNQSRAKRKVTLFSFYKKAHVEEENDNDMVNQNPQLEENELEEDLALAPPKVQKLNPDASVLIVERDPGLRCQI